MPRESSALAGMDALFRGGGEPPAIAKKKKSPLLALLKAKHQKGESVRESCRIVRCDEAVQDSSGRPTEGPIVRVVLISEGLGNLRDKNYYGPEAIQSAPKVFEGAVMMLDHQSYSEERDRPEGDVNKTVAYYKNLRVEKQTDGKLACVGEAHYDLTEEGLNAYQKAKTAVHYKEEFPSSDKEYVGLSVNASGESEPRTMIVEGQEMEVNYVMRFVEARSCDMVTIPARGGKIVATVESIAGARMMNQEVRMKTIETLQAVQAELKEAEGLDAKKLPDLRQKISEARKKVESLIQGALDYVAAKAKTKEGKGKDEDEEESEESKETNPDALASEDEAAEEESAEGEDGDGEDDGDEGGDTHTVMTHKVVKKTGKAAMSGESARLKKLAIAQLIAESGVKAKWFDVAELAGMSLKEAEREIARTKRAHEAAAEQMVERFGDQMPPTARAKESGGADGKPKTVEAVNNREFADITYSD